MAYGNLVMLKLTPEQFLEVGVKDEDREEAAEELKAYGYVEDFVDLSLQAKLSQAHLQLVQDQLDAKAYKDGADYDAVVLPQLQTVEGSTPRLSSFALENVEDGDENAYHYGVCLTSRYRPTWLDWAHPYGGSHLPVIFNQEFTDKVELARTALAAVHPVFLQADLAVVLGHF